MSAKDLLQKISDPKNFNMIWYLIHKRALLCRTPHEKEDFEKFVLWVVSVLPCNSCKDHATKYLSEYPIRQFFFVKDEKTSAEIGCFKWSWIFHNAVNRRLGKKEVDWITALSMYTSDEGCDNCGKDSAVKPHKVKISKH
jgi:hypothetical protein